MKNLLAVKLYHVAITYGSKSFADQLQNPRKGQLGVLYANGLK